MMMIMMISTWSFRPASDECMPVPAVAAELDLEIEPAFGAEYADEPIPLSDSSANNAIFGPDESIHASMQSEQETEAIRDNPELPNEPTAPIDRHDNPELPNEPTALVDPHDNPELPNEPTALASGTDNPKLPNEPTALIGRHDYPELPSEPTAVVSGGDNSELPNEPTAFNEPGPRRRSKADRGRISPRRLTKETKKWETPHGSPPNLGCHWSYSISAFGQAGWALVGYDQWHPKSALTAW